MTGDVQSEGWRYHLEPPVHVWPDGSDSGFTHDLDDAGDCACGPHVEWVDKEKLITHHALDGRERFE